MHAMWWCVAMTVAALSVTRADALDRASVSSIEAVDEQSLHDHLLVLIEAHVASAGLFVDRRRAWMTSSSPLPAAGTYEVRAHWLTDTQVPSLPVTFELWRQASAESAATGGDGADEPIRITVAAPLLREVWVASRRLRKGSSVACADFNVQRRELRDAPRLALALPCAIGPEAVALRELASGDVVRTIDVGQAPDVMAGTPVSLSVATKGINVTTTAIALADARVGDQIDVRLRRPTRTLKTRVTGRGSVQLIGGSL